MTKLCPSLGVGPRVAGAFGRGRSFFHSQRDAWSSHKSFEYLKPAKLNGLQ